MHLQVLHLPVVQELQHTLVNITITTTIKALLLLQVRLRAASQDGREDPRLPEDTPLPLALLLEVTLAPPAPHLAGMQTPPVLRLFLLDGRDPVVRRLFHRVQTANNRQDVSPLRVSMQIWCCGISQLKTSIV